MKSKRDTKRRAVSLRTLHSALRDAIAEAQRQRTCRGSWVRHGTNLDDSVLVDMELNGIRCLLIQKEFKSADHAPLTPREREIARLVACGQPNKAIAAQLEISSWTVGTHLRRIYSKLGVCCRAAMVARLEAERTPEHDYH